MTGPRCCCVWPASISSASEWYLGSEDYRRRILTQLNKGEALHGLREFLLFANKGTLRKKQEEELGNQAGCLNLVTNAVVTWNTVYMAAVIEQLRA